MPVIFCPVVLVLLCFPPFKRRSNSSYGVGHIEQAVPYCAVAVGVPALYDFRQLIFTAHNGRQLLPVLRLNGKVDGALISSNWAESLFLYICHKGLVEWGSVAMRWYAACSDRNAVLSAIQIVVEHVENSVLTRFQ